MSRILNNPYALPESHEKMHFVPEDVFDFKLDQTIDETVIIPEMKEALAKKQKKRIEINVSNLNRALGTLFGAEITRSITTIWRTTHSLSSVTAPAVRASAHSFQRV